MSAASREYYAANHDKAKARNRRYYAENREKERLRKQKQKARDPAKYLAQAQRATRKWYHKDVIHARAISRACYRRNHEKELKRLKRYRQSANGRIATRVSALVTRGCELANARIIIRAVERPETRCAVCGIPKRILDYYKRNRIPAPCSSVLGAMTIEVDRVVPGSMGGTYTWDNIRPLCSRCNCERSDAQVSDEVLRARAVRRWEAFGATTAELWWLNREPVKGGGKTEVSVRVSGAPERGLRKMVVCGSSESDD